MTAMPMLTTQKEVRHGPRLKLHWNRYFGEVSFRGSNRKPLAGYRFGGGGRETFLRYIILGVPSNLALKRGTRGGAFNSASRVSHALTVDQVANLIAASEFAETIGLPFTRMITVHWQGAGVALSGMAKATGRFIDLLTKALSRHAFKTAWLWVHENGERKGGHAHILVHVPAQMVPVIGKLQKRWLRSITGKPYQAGVICSRPIGGRLGLETGNPTVHAQNLETALGYVLKGANDEAVKAFTLERIEPGGQIIGKRCGTSQNISPKARKDVSKCQQ